MFPYDASLLAAVRRPSQSIPAVLHTLETIESLCHDDDGLKWFNWLYYQVTQAVETRVASGGFRDGPWLAKLDVQFARLYFGALEAALAGQAEPSCWRVLFQHRGQAAVARIQFALAGINAHINHDLPQAIVATCQEVASTPQHGTPQYSDYTALNTTLDGLVEAAKQTLHVRLLGDELPPVSHLEDTIASWKVSAAREGAWRNAELLWHLRATPAFSSGFMDTLNGLTTVAGKALTVPIP